MRPSWDEWGLALAQAVALRGDCVRSKVGAVIMGPGGRILGLGYNGTRFPGEPGCLEGACPRCLSDAPSGSSYEGCIEVHAEHNAVKDALYKRMYLGCTTIYVTRECCQQCEALLASYGITRIVTPTSGSQDG